MNLDPIVNLSRRFGADPDYVLAGGGNTSQKDGDTLAIKASGTQLATIEAGGFVRMSLSKLKRLFDIELPRDPDAREKVVLGEMLAARLPGQTMRPSVETLLHALFPFRFVVHLHPALVNGMLCSRDAMSAGSTLFGQDAETLPYITPGFILADAVRIIFEKRKNSGLSPLRILFLQNHGVFVAADSEHEIEALYARIFETLRAKVEALPDLREDGESAVNGGGEEMRSAIEAVKIASKKLHVTFFFTSNSLLRHFLRAPEAFSPLTAPFTPDHIVYAGAWPLYLSARAAQTPSLAETAINSYTDAHGEPPRIIALEHAGIIGLARDSASAERACTLFTDAAKIAWYARPFGGAQPMTPADVDFIRNWEVERYRSSVATHAEREE